MQIKPTDLSLETIDHLFSKQLQKLPLIRIIKNNAQPP